MLAAMGAVLHTGPLRGHHVELVRSNDPSPTTWQWPRPVTAARSGGPRCPTGPRRRRGTSTTSSPSAIRGESVPFAQRHLASGRLVGCTRFMDLRRWFGRAEPEEVEIGGTWLNAEIQRTPVNTEAKLLLFTHAFEVWRVRRSR